MPELRSADLPPAPDPVPDFVPVPASAHTATRAAARGDTRASASGVGDPPVGPSRLVPFLTYGALSLALFGIAGALGGNTGGPVADLSDYSCLGACLSGVAAAIFGCVTVSRALRRRAQRTRR